MGGGDLPAGRGWARVAAGQEAPTGQGGGLDTGHGQDGDTQDGHSVSHWSLEILPLGQRHKSHWPDKEVTTRGPEGHITPFLPLLLYKKGEYLSSAHMPGPGTCWGTLSFGPLPVRASRPGTRVSGRGAPRRAARAGGAGGGGGGRGPTSPYTGGASGPEEATARVE